MYFSEHNPPHFHVEYNEHKAAIEIKTLGVMSGKLPAKVLGIVVEWAENHQDELIDNWQNIKNNSKYDKIKPLV
jgi:hypothetical protein